MPLNPQVFSDTIKAIRAEKAGLHAPDYESRFLLALLSAVVTVGLGAACIAGLHKLFN